MTYDGYGRLEDQARARTERRRRDRLDLQRRRHHQHQSPTRAALSLLSATTRAT